MSRRAMKFPLSLALAFVGLSAAALPALAQERPTSPPPPMEPRPISFPGFSEFTLDNGLRVVVLEYGTQPLASVRLYIPAGSALEPAGMTGLTGLLAEVLTKGTESRSAEEISSAIEGVGANIAASAGRDFFTLSTSSVTGHLDMAVEVLADVARNATLPPSEVELARTRLISSLQVELSQPQAIANRRFRSLLYGDAHPYGRASTPETLRAVTRDDLVEFRDRHLHAGGALLFISGQLDRARAEALAREHFGALPSGTPSVVDFPPVADPASRRITLVHRPGSAQSVMGIGNLGVRAGDEDFFPLVVMDRVLGGGADSRLFRVLREEKGWTYGAYSSFDRPSHVGLVSVNTEVRTEVTDSSVVELFRQLELLRNEPVPADELEGAINYLAGSFPLRIETPDQVAGQVATALIRNRPMEEVTEYPQRIRAVTADDVQRVAQERWRTGALTVVVVGDGAQIGEKLEALGEVDYVDLEGAPLSRDEVMGIGAVATSWDASRLTAHTRRYDVYMQGNVLGSAEYRLEREGEDWLSFHGTNVAGTTSEVEIRLSGQDFSPIALRQSTGGAIATRAELTVVDGQVQGTMELPPQMGGSRELDLPLPDGALLAGMDELALAVAELGPDARLTLTSLDMIQGGVTSVQVRVTGEETITVPGGTFETWRVELSGGQIPLVLFLRKDGPHYMIRQEFVGQPVRFDLTLLDEER